MSCGTEGVRYYFLPHTILVAGILKLHVPVFVTCTSVDVRFTFGNVAFIMKIAKTPYHRNQLMRFFLSHSVITCTL